LLLLIAVAPFRFVDAVVEEERMRKRLCRFGGNPTA
jgi:hypothetical protein